MSKYNGSWAERSVAVGEYKAAPTTLSDGDRGEMQVDKEGFLLVNLGKAIKGEDLYNDVMKVEQQMSYQAVSTATTTTVKSGSGLLHSIIVTGGTAGTIVIYDNTAGSGTVIASFDSTNALETYVFNCKFSTGLTIVTGSATKVTAIYR
jgi:hypothetical protein